ncbi:TetR family transcriptional regulator [Pseudoclavibacter endophyticus]|uniref:TetR/AcrR family transcriptional regulator n=1 Tax=Pseudoclavibacter endophyticus TaxID=1778590 RepID=A0A6H9WLM7_9MICO|nr:TetR/AcrR family transcriptional regulator [Pseudoclavibacter endophyticus]KAB1649726.1 TetR/AcrR family transcriptional regulator [Pseudoclavibacter endophyticus]GGA60227.1 TetR family transcriptional regulator [Pseudoclavibacter endophyticus]
MVKDEEGHVLEDPSQDLAVPELTPSARRIVDAATQLFYRHGIHAVGVDTIARESGVTKRTLYDRFGSKDNLVAVYLRARHHTWWSRFQRRLDAAPPPRVLALFDSYAEDAAPSGRGCGFLNAAGELPHDHPAYAVITAHKRAVEHCVYDLIHTDYPHLEDPRALADEVFLLLEGAIAHQGIDTDRHRLHNARQIAEQHLGAAA